MRSSVKNKYYKKIIDLILSIQEKNGYFYYNGYYCNLELLGIDYLVYVTYFDQKEYFGLLQNVFRIETKKDFKSLESSLIENQNVSLFIEEYKFKNLIANYGNCISSKNQLFIYEIKYNENNYLRLYDDKIKDKIIYEKCESIKSFSDTTQFSYSNNMTYETKFLLNMIKRIQVENIKNNL